MNNSSDESVYILGISIHLRVFEAVANRDSTGGTGSKSGDDDDDDDDVTSPGLFFDVKGRVCRGLCVFRRRGRRKDELERCMAVG